MTDVTFTADEWLAIVVALDLRADNLVTWANDLSATESYRNDWRVRLRLTLEALRKARLAHVQAALTAMKADS